MIYDDQFKRLFEKNLREYLPLLRKEILNLADYVPREDYEELLDRQKDLQKDFDDLRQVNSQLKLNFENLQREKDSLIQHEEILSDKIDDLLAEKNSLQRQKDSLMAELEDVSAKLSEAEDNLRGFAKISAECDYYRDAYEDLDAAYKNYLSLDENIRYQLAGIFGDAQTVQGFLIGAANEKHLNDFWDYLRYSLNNKRLSADDAKILTGLFDFCFDALNNSSREPIYLRLQTERGSRFDSMTMTRTSNSRQLGRVQSVLLEGYADRVGNIIRQSLVFIAD